MPLDTPQINKLPAERVSCVLAGVLDMGEIIEGETHPEWCERNAGRFAFGPDRIIVEATSEYGARGWWQSGVYFLTAADIIVYVGRSNCVAKRIYEHLASGMPFDKAAAIIALPFPAQQEIEDAYYSVLRPPLNKMVTNSYLFSGQLQAMIRELLPT